MKRDSALVPLSRDHHQALFQAMRLKRATEESRADVVEGVLEFWHSQGARHFRIEEEVLLPAFARHGSPGDERVVRVLVDHVWIRERMARLETGALVEELNELGARLEAHVRHEERELFPLIEGALDATELIALGERVEAAEAEGGQGRA